MPMSIRTGGEIRAKKDRFWIVSMISIPKREWKDMGDLACFRLHSFLVAQLIKIGRVNVSLVGESETTAVVGFQLFLFSITNQKKNTLK